MGGSIIGIFGIVSDKYNRNLGSIRGGGKTATGAHMGLEAKSGNTNVITNFHTDFSEYQCFEQIAMNLYNGLLIDSLVIIDEVHVFFNSMDKDPDEITFAEDLCGQSRKLGNDLILIDQRFNAMHIRLRLHCDAMFRPFKIHDDLQLCPKPDCREHHFIGISCFHPIEQIIEFFDMDDVKNHYDTNEVIKRQEDGRLRDYIPYLRKGKRKEPKKKTED